MPLKVNVSKVRNQMDDVAKSIDQQNGLNNISAALEKGDAKDQALSIPLYLMGFICNNASAVGVDSNNLLKNLKEVAKCIEVDPISKKARWFKSPQNEVKNFLDHIAKNSDNAELTTVFNDAGVQENNIKNILKEISKSVPSPREVRLKHIGDKMKSFIGQTDANVTKNTGDNSFNAKSYINDAKDIIANKLSSAKNKMKNAGKVAKDKADAVSRHLVASVSAAAHGMLSVTNKKRIAADVSTNVSDILPYKRQGLVKSVRVCYKWLFDFLSRFESTARELGNMQLDQIDLTHASSAIRLIVQNIGGKATWHTTRDCANWFDRCISKVYNSFQEYDVSRKKLNTLAKSNSMGLPYINSKKQYLKCRNELIEDLMSALQGLNELGVFESFKSLDILNKDLSYLKKHSNLAAISPMYRSNVKHDELAHVKEIFSDYVSYLEKISKFMNDARKSINTCMGLSMSRKSIDNLNGLLNGYKGLNSAISRAQTIMDVYNVPYWQDISHCIEKINGNDQLAGDVRTNFRGRGLDYTTYAFQSISRCKMPVDEVLKNSGMVSNFGKYKNFINNIFEKDMGKCYEADNSLKVVLTRLCSDSAVVRDKVFANLRSLSTSLKEVLVSMQAAQDSNSRVTTPVVTWIQASYDKIKLN